MKNLLLAFLLICISSGSNSQVMEQKKNNLYIGSYNIYIFGKNKSKNNQTYNAARVLAQGSFDIVAIQEVMGEKGEVEVNNVVRFLKDSFNLEYKALISRNIGEGFGGQERIAFIYKPASIKPQSINDSSYRLIPVDSGRAFVISKWKSGDFEFLLGSCHLLYGSAKKKEEALVKRTAELQKVLDLFKDPLTMFGDEDLIFLGDFNRGGLVSAYKQVDYDTSNYFIPNIETFDPSLNTVPEVKQKHVQNMEISNKNPQLHSSTVSENTFLYDMIICSKSLLDNYGVKRDAGVFNVNYGIISYDERDGIGMLPDAVAIKKHTILKSTFSDHRPVWVRIGIKDK